MRLDPTEGAESRKIRPAIIVQNDISNQYSPLTVVIPLSNYKTDDKIYPTETLIPAGQSGLANDSIAMANQIRALDKNRLLKKLGMLDSIRLELIDRTLLVTLGLFRF